MKSKLAALTALVIAGGALAYLSMGNLGDNLVYYWSPTELVEAGAKAQNATIRLGGMVVPDSVVDGRPKEQSIRFEVSDGQNQIEVLSTGVPPQMFRPGIGVVVEGVMGPDEVFQTDRIMIKHSNEFRAPEDGEDPSSVYKTLVTEE